MIIKTLEQYKQFASKFNWNIFAFDTETTDLDYFKLDIEGISLYDSKHPCYIDLWENPEIDHILMELWMQLSSAGTLIGHNLVFDLEVLAKVYGIQNLYNLMNRCNLIDTYLADCLIDERNKHSLKGVGGCTERYLGREAQTYQEAKKYARNSPEFAKYATDDAVNTWDVWKCEAPLLKEQNLMKVFDIENKFIPVIVEMELTGMKIDQDLLRELESNLDVMKLDLEEQILKSLGDNPTKQGYMFGTPVEALNLNSPKKLPKFIKEHFGIDVPNADKNALKPYVGKHPFFELLLKYRAVNKLLSTYVSNYWDLIKPDNRIHPEFQILVSGRNQCVPLDAEILTDSGWKKHDELNIDDKVMSYNILTEQYEWSVCQGKHYDTDEVGFVKWNNGHSKPVKGFLCTKNHNWVVNNPQIKGFVKAIEPQNRNKRKLLQPKVEFPKEERTILTPYQAGLLGWYLTDGTAVNSSRNKGMSITLTKKSSIKWLDKFLKNGDFMRHEYDVNDKGITRTVTRFYIRTSVFNPVWEIYQIYNPSTLVMYLSSEARKTMYNAMLEGDGSKRHGCERYDRFGTEKTTYKQTKNYFSLLSIALGQPYTIQEQKLKSGNMFLHYNLLKKELYSKDYRWKPFMKPKCGVLKLQMVRGL